MISLSWLSDIIVDYYRLILLIFLISKMGVTTSAELWNNLGLCCFYAQQYDMTLSCFERALALAEDDNMPDIW
jgi:tetratricopeptide repeat protein 8